MRLRMENNRRGTADGQMQDQKKRKKKISISSILLVLVLLAGVGLMAYPSLSEYYNSIHQSQAVARYTDEVSSLTPQDYSAYLEAAQAYNLSLNERADVLSLTTDQELLYPSILKLPKTDVMAYVEIPSIKVRLPIYHGTDESVLQEAVGHVEWTSVPIGGEGTHAVLSGHRGLPSAKLFSDLDDVKLGDVFYIHVLGQTLTYEVDEINVVLPEELRNLVPFEGEDLVTLVTCTPYGVNTHRLLVRGHRIETQEQVQAARVTNEAGVYDPLFVSFVLVAPILVIIFLKAMLSKERA